MTLVVGFAGPAQAGKSTAQDAVADFAKDNNLKHEAINYADSLRELTREINPWISYGASAERWNDLERERGYEWMKKYTDARDFLVGLGNGARAIDPYFWVNAWKEKVEQSTADIITVADVRYLNELFRYIAASVVYYVERDGVHPANPVELVSLEMVKSHINPGFHVTNNGTAEQFRSKIRDLVDTHWSDYVEA